MRSHRLQPLAPRHEAVLGRYLAQRLLLTVVGMSLLVASSVQARPAPASFADLAERLLPAVVNISTSQMRQSSEFRGPEVPDFPPGSPFEEFFKEFFDRQQQQPEGQRRRKATSLGSGFIIDPSGYVVTNNHVIADADEITVILQDDTRLDAQVVGRDPKTDLAVLKVNAKGKLPSVSWGDSNKIRVGDWVLAIGNPFGLGGSVTAGIVSARQRDINSGPYDDFLQTDAAINRGNSGGPLFNMNGEVVGVNTAIISPQGTSVGVGFSIPSALVKNVVSQLREFGRTRRGWLGVRIQSVTDDIAESLGLDKPAGALVANVTDEGPAKQSGITEGDVILEFDGKPVPVMRKLPRIVAETPVGKAVKVVVWRKGEKKTFMVTLGELEEAEKAQQASLTTGGGATPETGEALGLTLSAMDAGLRERFSIADEVEGIVIVDVKSGSPAAQKGLRAGDVIVEAGQDKVSAPNQITAKIEEARKAGRKSVLLLVVRKADKRFIVLKVDEG